MEERTYKSLIADENVIRNFYNTVLNNLESHEVNFVSIAARKKYLTEKEASVIKLGNTQMLGKTVIKENNVEKFLNRIKQLDAQSSFYEDFDGNIIPRTCMSYYININPSSVLKTLHEFKNVLASYDLEATYLLMNNNAQKKEEYFGRLKTLVNKMYTCFQTCRSKKRWIDIDCDVTDTDIESLFNVAKEFVASNKKFEGCKVVGIVTRGGLHILLSTDNLKGNPQLLVETLQKYVKENGGDYKEILLNKNEMIPLPGTYQGNKVVRMLV